MGLLPIADRNRIFIKDKNELMSDDPRFILAWTKLEERIIRINKKERTGKSRETMFMENYFKWQPPSNSKWRWRKNKHQKNDLKTD
jgi:hypothetical protein